MPNPMNAYQILSQLPDFVNKMKSENLPQVVIDTFAHYYRQIVAGATGMISDNDIEAVNDNDIADATQLKHYAEKGGKALDKVVMIILNGGLGTNMGLKRAKTLLTVKDGKSFLDIIVEQANRKGINLAFMNSFNTHQDTMAAIKARCPECSPLFFLQHKFPKIMKDGLGVARWPSNPSLEWNPPGHGDIYTALQTSGLLEKMVSDGMKYALIVNADNLGASLDKSLLGYFVDQGFPIMMEVAQRTPSDMKGGHLARHRDGRLVLREIAQCPENECKAFQDIQYFRFFNTNSIWINLIAFRNLIYRNPVIHLPIILNAKTLDPRDKDSPKVYQIETAMGSAISLFQNAAVVKVPVERFSPVKKTPDLLALRSDCYTFSSAGDLVPNPQRIEGRIHIQLDDDYYGKIDDFEKRFAKGVPSLISCKSLVIKGDVHFEKNVRFKGHVHIHNTRRNSVTIPAGTVVDGDLIF